LKEARPRLVTPVFLLIMLSTLAYFVAIGAILPVLPRFIEGPLGGGSLAVGLGVGSFSVTALLLRPVAGRLGDRRGRRLLVVCGASLVGLSMAGLGLAKSFPELVGLRLLAGAGEAFFFTGVASVIHDLAPDERRGEAVSYFSLALYAGIALGPVIGEALLGDGRFARVWWVGAGLAVVAALLALRLPDTRTHFGGAGEVRGRLIHPAAVLPGLVATAAVMGFSGFASFVPLYALRLGMSGSGLVFVLFSVVVLAIRSLGARLPDQLGPRKTSRIALGSAIAGLLLTAAWATPAGLYLGTVGFAVGQALFFPGLMTIAVHGAPESERGAVVGTFTAFFDLGYGLGGLALGSVAALFGYRAVFVAGAVAAAGGLALFTASEGRMAIVREDV
jgi:MFS family permease